MDSKEFIEGSVKMGQSFIAEKARGQPNTLCNGGWGGVTPIGNRRRGRHACSWRSLAPISVPGTRIAHNVPVKGMPQNLFRLLAVVGGRPNSALKESGADYQGGDKEFDLAEELGIAFA